MGFQYRTWGNSWGNTWLNSWGLGAVVDFIREWWLILRGRVVSYKLRDDITITLEPNLATVSAEAPTHDILIDESQSLTATQAEASTEELWVKT